MRKCASEGCGDEAQWIPVLVMDGDAGHKHGSRAEVDLPLCNDHMLVFTMDDLIRDDNWESICVIFTTLGRIMPQREDIQLDFKSISSGYVH